MIVDIFTINEFRVHPFVASTTRQALKAIDTSGLRPGSVGITLQIDVEFDLGYHGVFLDF